MDYNIFLLSIQDKINHEDYLNLKVKLEQLQNKDRFLSNLSFLQLQNPITPLISSIICACFALGWLSIDRFIIKDFALAALRVILSFWCWAIFLFLAVDYENNGALGTSEIFLILSMLFLLLGVIWWAIDLFLVYKKVKKQNYNRILEFIFNSTNT